VKNSSLRANIKKNSNTNATLWKITENSKKNGVSKECIGSKWPIRLELIPVFVLNIRQLGAVLFLLHSGFDASPSQGYPKQ